MPMVLYDWARANGHALLSNFIFNIHTGICHLDRSMERYGPFSVPLTQQKPLTVQAVFARSNHAVAVNTTQLQ